jgi:hypothetical protein
MYPMRYFKIVGRQLEVELEPDWTHETVRLYFGVKTELSETECTELIWGTYDLKLGGAREARMIWDRAEVGLSLQTLSRTPPDLPMGFVYFTIDREDPSFPIYWKGVVESQMLGIYFPTIGIWGGIRVMSDRVLSVPHRTTGRTCLLKFAVFAEFLPQLRPGP